MIGRGPRPYPGFGTTEIMMENLGMDPILKYMKMKEPIGSTNIHKTRIEIKRREEDKESHVNKLEQD